MKKLAAVLFTSLSAAAFSSPAYASVNISISGSSVSMTNSSRPAPSPSVYGYDVSYPQCGKALPTGQQFGVAGLNDGLANTLNPCFAAELAWAQASKGGTGQPLAAVYVNTANPGDVTPAVTDWPTSGTNGYGTCNGSNSSACAYEYGRERAVQDVTWAGSGQLRWWLDVEAANSWSVNLANNAADLEGMTEYFESQGGQVGVYSTGLQWGQIIGTYNGDGSLLGLQDWVAGATSLAGAQANCFSTPFTPLGLMSVAQYVPRGAKIDSDYSCL